MLTVNAASGFGSGGGGRAAMGDLHQTNLVFHFRADTGITEATGVSNWVDQVSGSTELVQSTTANQPSYDATETVGTLTGAGAMTFDGSNDSLIGTSVTSVNQPYHIFIVFKPVSWVAGKEVFTGGTAGPANFAFGARYGGSSPQYDINAGAADVCITEFAIGTWALGIVLFDGASSSLAMNDDAATGGSPGTGDMGNFFILGANAVNPPSGAWGNFAVAELAIYDDENTGSDLTDIKTYINDQYGLW